MEELIKIHKTKNGDVVSGRDLHEFLLSKQDFSTWIKAKIEKYDFIENKDFVTFHKIVERATRIEYALTVKMAKELSMVEANERGKMARRYFIACEEKLLQMSVPSYQIEDPIIRAETWIQEQKEKQELQLQISQMEPKAKAAEILLLSNDDITIGQFAKAIGTGQNRLFKKLKEDKILISDGAKKGLPYQRFLDAGYFSVCEVTKTADNKIKVFPQSRITPKGQVYLSNRYHQ